jgi:Uma2 family endonuclease
MTDLTRKIRTSGEVIASGVSYEDFLKTFDDQHVEWVHGDVIRMSPVSTKHSQISAFLDRLFDAYLALTIGGEVFQDPVVMRARADLPARAPDLQVILPENTGIIKENEVAGPADLVVEIVSPESHRRDRIEKFSEYEQGGVKEYWIIDPARKETLFYQLDDSGFYAPVNPDEGGIYRSRVLGQLRLPVDIFWREELPRVLEIMSLVTAMLEEDSAE